MNDKYQLILIYIDRLYLKYKFLGLTRERFISIIRDRTNNLSDVIESKLVFNYSNLENYFQQIIYEYIKKQMDSKQNRVFLLGNYINQFISVSNNYEDAVKMLTKLCNFFSLIEYIPDLETLKLLVKENDILSSNLIIIVREKYQLIKNREIHTFIKNDILVSLIEVYCMLNGILNIDDDVFIDNATKEYITEVTKIPVLTEDEILELVCRMQSGDEFAKQTLIERNLHLVISIAKTYKAENFELLDHIQNGNLGLIIAVEKFDINMGYRFLTYAARWINYMIQQNICDASRTIKIPRYKYEQFLKYINVSLALEKKLNCKPTYEDIANEMGLSIKDIYELDSLQLDVCSLDMFLNEENQEMEEIVSRTEESIDEKVERLMLKSEINNLFIECGLTPKELKVIKLRNGFITGREERLRDIAIRMNCTTQNVSLLEHKALKRIRKYLKTK